MNHLETQIIRKPAWIRIRPPNAAGQITSRLRAAHLHTVCEEAKCPNRGECFTRGTATFLIMGNICTRRCPFCNIRHGQPLPLDPKEPQRIAETAAALHLNYLVITSVNRDDLRDGGAAHFAASIQALRNNIPQVQIEILVPDFRGRVELALEHLSSNLPDIFNHNLETVPRLYPQVRPGADYQHSLKLLQTFTLRYPQIPTKSGLMLGLGETPAEIQCVLRDLRAHGCARITLGQYLQPTIHHLPVQKFIPPEEFYDLQLIAKKLGFTHIASAPLVRSSYHAAEYAQLG